MSFARPTRFRLSRRGNILFLAAAAAALILAALWLIVQRADRNLRGILLQQARLTAGTIHPELVAALRGTEADLDSPEYARLKDQLISIRASNLECQFVYLLGRRGEGPVFFFVDSESADSPDCSPPGQVYEEASAVLLDTISIGREQVEGPEKDRWGNWITAFVPLRARRTDGAKVLLGMEIDSRDWYKALAARSVLPASLAFIAILLGTFAILLQRSCGRLRARQLLLVESELHYAQLARQSRTFAWEVDPQGRYTFVAPDSELVIGYRPEELVGRMHFYDLHPEDDREAFQQTVFRKMANQEIFVNFENPMFTKTEQRVWVITNGAPFLDENGTLRGYRGINIDITARKLAEDQVGELLEESNRSRRALLGILEDQTRTKASLKRLATAIDQAAETVVVTDAQGLIQYVNPAFEAVTGYTREEGIGQNPRILKSDWQDAGFYREMWKILASGKTWRGRFVNKRKNGSLFTEDAVISPVQDAAGRIINYVAVKHDVTEHLLLTNQLQQSQKMDAVGRLAGGVAHDFNNMLTVILGHAELALENTSPDQPLHAELREIQKAAQHSADLTRQLLTFARKQLVKPKVLDLNETVADMLKLLQRLIGENIELAWLPGRNLWPIMMDPSQLDQILANLCLNARDAIGGTGTGKVTLETKTIAFDEAYGVEHVGISPGEYVLLSVSDNGCGMDGQTRSSIFEPFFTTKGEGKGTGLGLATVYGIVMQNNGYIHVYSEPGHGTTFHIYLPRHAGETGEIPPPDSPEPVPRGHETVLLVEDDLPILKISRFMLKRLGYQVLATTDPAETTDLIRNHPGEIHLLMTDVIMPGMNGRELAQKLMALHPRLKLLFMSGYTADVIAHHGVLDSGVNFIQKPFSMKDLATKLREVLAS